VVVSVAVSGMASPSLGEMSPAQLKNSSHMVKVKNAVKQG